MHEANGSIQQSIQQALAVTERMCGMPGQELAEWVHGFALDSRRAGLALADTLRSVPRMSVPKLSFTRTTTGITLEGRATPNAVVTAENLSAAPFGPSKAPDTFAKAKADAQGHFKLTVPLAMEGDKLGLRIASGPVSLLDVRLGRTEKTDGRRAEIGHQGLRMVPGATEGSYTFDNVRQNKKLGEPGAQFILTNTRTKEKTTFILDGRGRLPEGSSVNGKPGDAFGLNVSDGVNNQYMKDTWSQFVIPPQPDAKGITHPTLPPDMKAGAKMKMLEGPLFVDGAQPSDAMQGSLGDCYLVSAAAAIAVDHPEVLKKMMKDNADGTVTVTFKRFDDVKRAYVDHPITVTREVPMHWGKPLFGSQPEGGPAGKECWFPILEKAYAAWKGGYSATECGYPYEMFEAFLGTEGRHLDVRGLTETRLWNALKTAADRKEPVVVWSGQEGGTRKFTNTGLYADHAYTLMGVTEENGKRSVVLRNPWGQGEPRGNGVEDGVFTLPLETFQKFYVGVGIAS